MKPIYSIIILLFLSCAEDKQSTPNIVLIIGDDHGWPYYGFMGNEYVETPVLDQLADSGLFSPMVTLRPRFVDLL